MNGTVAEWMILGLIMFVILLIVAYMVMEYKADRAEELAEEAIEKLADLLYVLNQAHIETGVCCCGDNMATHDTGYNCGHSALDMWDYHGEPVLQSARLFVRQYKSDV